MTIEQLLEIERGFWFEGAQYYRQHISDAALFVFPGTRLSKQDGVEVADQSPRWESLDFTEEQLIEVSDKVMILSYHAEGHREDQPPYTGYITTVYRLEDDQPKMIFHQHSPDPKE